ncbi:MAG TPA: hypothetical protein VGQ23_17495, partial [Burkholderiaceae bacterium]|nr:hypothetical protein [Burkholderiaceae bacterium]
LRGQCAVDSTKGLSTDALSAALRALLGECLEEPARRADVVIESAWLPLMLLEVGAALLSVGKVQALLRHRLGELYGPVDGWDLDLDYRPGDLWALGYGLAPSVKQAIAEAAADAGMKLASMQPAFQWASRRLERADGWWIWREQDRSLVSRIERGHVIALNAAAPLARDEAHGAQLAAIEARRHGVVEQDVEVVAAGWYAPWVSVATEACT